MLRASQDAVIATSAAISKALTRGSARIVLHLLLVSRLIPSYHEIMKYHHDSKPPGSVREPVQVYLDPADRERLERLTGQLETTKSDVLRKALEALERELSDPSQHPALRIIGIAGDSMREPGAGYDVAREHDRFLAESELRSWEKDD
jgi:hypothetical protein